MRARMRCGFEGLTMLPSYLSGGRTARGFAPLV
jgi:hypothetical protein